MDRTFVLGELVSLPGARIVKRKGQLFLKSKNGFEILCQRLFEMRTRWVELVEYADLAEEDKWAIFCLMLVDVVVDGVPQTAAPPCGS
jgi:hypothetical protein